MGELMVGITVGVLVILVLVGAYVIKTYNKLVNLRINVDRQASHVQAHLKKKFELIPALVEIVKGYTKHEKGTFEEITRLRSQWSESKTPEEQLKTANMLESALSKLLLIQERYPNLKADKSFLDIQRSINNVEKELVHERKVYNKRVSWYNVKLQEIPSNIVAKLLKFEEKPFYSLEIL